MSHYRITSAEIDIDTKFDQLPLEAQWLWFRLFNRKHNTQLGTYQEGRRGLSEHFKKLQQREFDRYFFMLTTQKFISYDEKNHLIWFPKFLKHNRPASPNCVKSWEHVINMIPDCDLKTEIIQCSAKFVIENLSKAFWEALPKAFQEALKEGLPQDFANQKQEQNTGTEYNNFYINTEHDLNCAREEKLTITEKTKEKIVLEFPAKIVNNFPSKFPIFESTIKTYEKIYPAVDVLHELINLKNWMVENNCKMSYTKIPTWINEKLNDKQSRGAQISGISSKGASHANGNSRRSKQPSAYQQAMSSDVQLIGERYK